MRIGGGGVIFGRWIVSVGDDDEDDIDGRAKEVTSLNIFTSFYHHQHTATNTTP